MNVRPSNSTVIIVLILATATFSAGCGSKAEVATETAPPVGEIRVYEVFGMDCPGCHGGLEKLMNAITGVAGSQAAWDRKKLTVYVAEDGNVDDADIAAAIRKANFTPGERLE